MTRMTKALLVLALAGLGAGLVFSSGVVEVQNTTSLYVALPAGAIFLGLFLISKMLEKEAAAYDREQQAAISSARHLADRARGVEKSVCECDRSAEPAAAVAARH